MLAKKATVAVSPKILQLELYREMFSAKYGRSGAIKRIKGAFIWDTPEIRIIIFWNIFWLFCSEGQNSRNGNPGIPE